MLSGCLLVVVVAEMARRDKLGPNSLVGVKTRTVRRSRATWYAGHRAAAPWLRRGGVAGGVASVVGMLLPRHLSSAAVLMPVGCLLAGVLAAQVAADRAAGRVEG
jgi:hypothetical protein